MFVVGWKEEIEYRKAEYTATLCDRDRPCPREKRDYAVFAAES